MRVGLGGITGTRILSVGLGTVSVGGGGGFVGPYDAVPSITAAYGVRRLLSSYTGPILRLRRDSDNTEQDIGYVANGDLDTAAAAAFLDGANGHITTWYDQSGNANHATQATAAAQPLLVSGINSLPNARFNAAAQQNLVVPVLWPDTVQVTALVVAQSSDASSAQRFLQYKDAGAWLRMAMNEGANLVFGVNDAEGGKLVTSSVPVTQPNLCVLRIVENEDVNGWVNGQAMTGNGTPIGELAPVGGGVPGGTIGSGRHGSTPYFTGDIGEVVIANAAWSTESRQAAESAANDYWQVY